MKKIVVVLLLLGIGVFVLFASRDKILASAAKSGNSKLIGLAIRLGANVNAPDAAGVPPIVAAAGSGNAEAVRRLLDAKADVDAKESESGRTALMVAADAGDAASIDALLQAKPTLNLLDKGDKSAYSYAFAKNHFDIAHKVRFERPPVVVDFPPREDPNAKDKVLAWADGTTAVAEPVPGSAATRWRIPANGQQQQQSTTETVTSTQTPPATSTQP